MEEPSVLDYVKSKLMPWRGQHVEIPEPGSVAEVSASEPADVAEISNLPPVLAPVSRSIPAMAEIYRVPWLAVLALLLALLAQAMFEPPRTFWPVGLLLYGLSAGLLIWSSFTREGLIRPIPAEKEGAFSTRVRMTPFLVSLGLIVIGYFAFGGNRFTDINVIIWLLLIICVFWAWWMPAAGRGNLAARVSEFFRRERWQINLTRWGILIILVLIIAVFYRFYLLSSIPGEMISDHAEKLLDVNDLLNGQTKIFFERNTGREFFQFYLTAAIIQLFNTGISFLSLKIGTALAGFLTLPYVYKLGKEIGGRWVGLGALFLTAIAYWPNVNARFGLRFPFYPLFAAPALYYLIRGLRTRDRNLMILSGLAVGIGLHGYSPFRIIPFVVVTGVVLYLLHRQSRGNRQETIWALVVLALVAFVIFLPLFRYATWDNPEMFGYRAFSRLGSSERALPGSPLVIFLQNLWSASIMPFWDNNNIWVHSVTNRPALDIVSAALFFLGLVVVLVRYARERNWVDLFMVISIPMLMLPSILSLAFPEENPSLNRTGAAYIPIFIIAAIGAEAVLRVIRRRMGPKWGTRTAVIFTGFLMLWSASQNFDLVFRQYNNQFMAGAWNTSDIGRVVRGFADSVGTPDTAYVAGYPYWVDTRLVGINAGFPTKDYAIWAKDFEQTIPETRTKMFIIKTEDSDSLKRLLEIYPGAIISQYKAAREGKDFLIVLVPGLAGPQP